MPSRVLIVHTNPIIVSGLRAILEQAAMKVVGEAVEWEPLVALMQAQHPDVVLLDRTLPCCLPGYGAANLLIQLRALDGRCGIFVLSPSPSVDEQLFFHFFKCGAMAYESLLLSPQLLVEKVRRVADREYLMVIASAQSSFCPLASGEVEELALSASGVQTQGESDFPILSERQLDALRLIARGYSNAMVGDVLGISDQTVKNHVSSILMKCDVFDRTAAVMGALLSKQISLAEFDLTSLATKRHRWAPGTTASHPSVGPVLADL